MTLIIIGAFFTSEGLAKKFRKRPHIGNPVKSIKKGAGKAGNAMKKGAGKAGKAIGGSLKIVDKALVKAGLPNSADIKRTLKCIVPTLKDLNALRKNPKNSALLEKLKNSTCVEEMKILDDDCHKPTIFAASMIPNVGGTISYICGQIGSINSRLESAFDKAEQAQIIAKNPKKFANAQLSQTMDELGSDDLESNDPGNDPSDENDELE